MNRLLRYLLLPSAVTSFEERYLHRMNRIALGFFWLHPPCFMAVAKLSGTSVLLALMLSIGVMIGPTIAYIALASNPRLVSTVYGVTAMVMGGVLVYIGQGPMQIEMHFYFFVLIALLAVFGNPLVIVLAAATVAAHHLVVWMLMPRGVFNYDASVWAVAVHALFVVLESVAACFVARSFFDNVIGLERIVNRRTADLDERNREMRLILDSVAQGFVMVDVDGKMATERSAIVDAWFGEPAPETTFVSFIEPHAAEFAAWFELAFSTIKDGFVPVDLCIAQMPKRFAVAGRAFEVSYRTILNGDQLDRILVIISDVTAQIIRERAEREQRELLGMFQRITNDRTGVDELMLEVKELLATLAAPCDVVVERRILHTLKGNCALFGLELYSELCHAIENEMQESLRPLSEIQRQSLVDGWQIVASWMERLGGANRDDIVEVEVDELAQVIQRAEQGVSSLEIAAALTLWTLEPVGRRFDRLAQHARGLARRLCKGELEVKVIDGGVRLDGARWSAFWAASVHAVRNSIDHGIETAEVRMQLGKPASGLLTFIAEQSPDTITIKIDDDGQGVDWDVIRERARAAGMPHESHEDLLAALFADGVTSRAEVTETSGRGLGMAALHQVVTDLGGTIDVTTQRAIGTRISCRFPAHHPAPPTRAASTRTYTSTLGRLAQLGESSQPEQKATR